MNYEIIEQIQHLFTGADERNWEKVAATLDEKVLLDYSSMNGAPATWLTPDEIITIWAGFLPGFDSTRHQLSGFSMGENEYTASVHFSGKADHFINVERWTVEGTYDVELIYSQRSWRITALKFNLSGQSGNTALPALAVERMNKA
ncbi:hypothetical protein HNQ91_002302 [Filimonas zeae]|uniref:SnoaL-like domain-containing protein n=1 Tax=Filimonas zeae TaxID=1737353 RepID=A0A917MW81_9BACT|nr:nuclear transport factor 2 family protein [Filimonas zeae]MDR6339251.1 hypothetical protein [Filimonas zeae]GGH64424.1 hypothetical protein GCM10011379_16460 [Filimonas zeae]